MLPGLVAYGDDSDDEHQSSSPPKPSSNSNGHGHSIHDSSVKTKSSVAGPSESRKLSKSQIIIKRPPMQHKTRQRTLVADDDALPKEANHPESEPSASTSAPQNAVASSSSHGPPTDPQDELAQIRALLQPPPILGVPDWGIPPASTEPCDPALQTKLAQFHTLKTQTPPKHFNDSLMGSRAFRNPHLYAQLVQFVDVDERTTNFPPELWDPGAVEEEWYADAIAALQKKRSEQQSAAQAPGKRSQIQFTAGTSSSANSTSKKEKERDKDKRYQPYGSGGGGGRERTNSRWG